MNKDVRTVIKKFWLGKSTTSEYITKMNKLICCTKKSTKQAVAK